MQRRLSATCLALATFAAIAAAPAHADYVGPSVIPASTVKALADTGRDDQAARLRGRLVGSLSGNTYRFRDASGEMVVKIKPALWPAGVNIGETTEVELVGVYDKELLREGRFKVKQLRPL
ncbi:hypothetical protein BKK81_20810 [Cupriavidus sp. USMAHM13]|uniref:YgiW/YdeI family stress tolerance OB fold protein n=1 Tax=Cupriavidus sp. USMAHM13 TaxID=1389192 RepID=UPI0008A6CFB6|nr:NirD/YgiW/YdeI family stress tolerance protein [Cupriavidus sp. USMAHM13]AOZ01811.1 hypothetical protein BKK81_20810 [Cupriavidus sp. USMAHM13]